jgi:hypothetical protein
MGIMHEVSYSAVIRNNTVRRNGWGFSAYIWGAGILVSASSDVEVAWNLLDGNADGIGAAQQNRGSGAYGPYEVWNLWMHDNTVLNPGNGWSGFVQDIDSDPKYFTSRNNRFQNNHYQLGNNTWFLQWRDLGRTVQEWQSFGQDATGTFFR